MSKTSTGILLILICLLVAASICAKADDPGLKAAFAGAQAIDLRTCKVSSVVALREKVGIAPSRIPVLVKVFDRKSLPIVLRRTFNNPGIAGVTINGRYIAIVHTELRDEYADILRHELVHAYISLASPKPLPLWFQEGSAIHFSMGKDRKFYGQPSKDQVGMMVGKTVELTEDYKQKLQTFNYVLDTVGEKQFNKWYKGAVEAGNVDPRPLLGLEDEKNGVTEKTRNRLPVWVGALVGAAVIGVIALGYFLTKRDGDYY